ncbi:MAG TPA: hypothetical protein VL463_11350 [Kofleriaceae bacterium]|jgi:hypothetical protein|nr:hypothetical protein [Kofleriaceae bacterium]
MLVTPDEPVGNGARWHEDVVYGKKTASIDVELIEREGTRVREHLRYHVDTAMKGDPATRDGTAVLDCDYTEPDVALHENEALVIDHPNRRVEATMVSDTVKVP